MGLPVFPGCLPRHRPACRQDVVFREFRGECAHGLDAVVIQPHNPTSESTPIYGVLRDPTQTAELTGGYSDYEVLQGF